MNSHDIDVIEIARAILSMGLWGLALLAFLCLSPWLLVLAPLGYFAWPAFKPPIKS